MLVNNIFSDSKKGESEHHQSRGNTYSHPSIKPEKDLPKSKNKHLNYLTTRSEGLGLSSFGLVSSGGVFEPGSSLNIIPWPFSLA